SVSLKSVERGSLRGVRFARQEEGPDTQKQRLIRLDNEGNAFRDAFPGFQRNRFFPGGYPSPHARVNAVAKGAFLDGVPGPDEAQGIFPDKGDLLKKFLQLLPHLVDLLPALLGTQGDSAAGMAGPVAVLVDPVAQVAVDRAARPTDLGQFG